MHVVGISGSLRAASTNGRLLLAAAAFVPPGTTMVISSPLRDLPPFDPDVAPDSHPAVAAWVREIREADGLIVSTPEYARGYPGSLKNALDWLVGTDAFIEKPFMLLSASPRSAIAQQTLTTVLEAMSGIHISAASTTIPLLGTDLDTTQIKQDPEFSEKLRAAMKTFITEIENRGLERGGRMQGSS
jgi:NAD(P)H-dependent FMN reductase